MSDSRSINLAEARNIVERLAHFIREHAEGRSGPSGERPQVISDDRDRT